jgi:acetamidase/formamidase
MEDARNAVRDMDHWPVGDQQLSLHEVYATCSEAADLNISQTADLPNRVVPITVPRGMFV